MPTMRTLSSATICLLLLVAGCGFAAEAAVADPLVEKLAQNQGIADRLVVKDGKYSWSDGKALSLRVTDLDKGGVILAVEGVQIEVPQSYVIGNRSEIAALIPALAKAAHAAGLGGVLKLECTGLTGPIIRTEQAVVMDGKVLKLAAATAPDRARDKERLRQAAEAFKPKLATLGMSVEARTATEDILTRLARDDGKEAPDEITPAFARRLVRSGWLAQLSATVDKATAEALKQAVIAAEKFQPVKRFAEAGATGIALAEVRDAFGHGGWTLISSTRCGYAIPQPDPLFMRPINLELVVDLPAKADPFSDADKAIGARICHDGRTLGTWDGKAFTADGKLWREAVPEERNGSAAPSSLPPHLMLCSFNGDRRKLIVPGGSIAAPKDASPAETSRFLSEAAKALPNAEDMDLIGQYFFRYVYDSPDPRFAMAVGNKQQKGDIHQTAAQTVCSVTGGMMRGDCDDIAELYQAIREKQGGYGHCVMLPGHTAFVWAVKESDDWRVNLLQTGPLMSFKAKALSDALKQLYTHFDPTSPFDPNGVGILLRFSGENTRGPWRLSSRIFAEPEYSKAMVEVQRDWQYQTYARGITTMKKMIEAGDKDPANYRELAGLASFTGQHGLAAEWNQKAIESAEDPIGRLTMNLEQVAFLHDAGDDGKARALVADILDNQLPPVKAKLGDGLVHISIQLAALSATMKSPELATRAIKDIVPPLYKVIQQLNAFISSPQFNQTTWDTVPQVQTMRRVSAQYVNTGLLLLKDIDKDKARQDPVLVAIMQSAGEWLTRVAFVDVDDQTAVLTRYAEVAAMHRFLRGDQELLSLIEKAAFPDSAKKTHTQREALNNPPQVEADLPWIKLSVPFWLGLLSEQFARDKEALDLPLAKRLSKGFTEAAAACKKLGLTSSGLDTQVHLGTVIIAMLDQDAKTLRERLKFVAKEDDKRLRDSTAQWLGDCARWADEKWYDQVIQIWKEEVNYKPKWFWIAWRAALNKAPRQALAVAKRAAQEFKDDPSFTEEYTFMRQLLEGAK